MMRLAFTVLLLIIVALPGLARQPEITSAAAEHNAAGWAEWEAQARITDGDYDGAVQAEQQAAAARQQVQKQDPHTSNR